MDRDQARLRSQQAVIDRKVLELRSMQAARRDRVTTFTRRHGPGRSAASAGAAGGADRASFAALARRLGGVVGVAFSAPGLGQPVTRLGSWSAGPAWSTMKVPVATALVARDGAPGGATAELMSRAITASDNAAAEQLWSQLGDPAQAGSAVEQILARAGDRATRVQTQVVRAGFSSFGQTDWALEAQDRFVAALPCLGDAAPVLSRMGAVVADQRWGLGSVDSSARFKGGWGPGPSGGYLVRQMGLIKAADGSEVAVALAAEPADGSFATGTTNVTKLARWAADNAHGAATPSC